MDKELIMHLAPQITSNLRKFGYQDLTEDTTRAQLELITSGQEPTDIIGMFAKGMLEDNGLIPED